MINSGFLTLQKEFMEKVFAMPRNKAYSYLTVVFNYFYNVKKSFSIPRAVFAPIPRVDSPTFYYFKQEEPLFSGKDQLLFLSFIKQSFVFKRKTLLNN